MPSVVTDTDDFVANVQRPNNGENADAASLEQGFTPLTKRTRWVYNRHRDLVFDATRAPFNAPITTASDAQPAIQAALDAASVRGGVVVLPGGSYRLDSALTFYPGVRFIGDPDRTSLLVNHATADILSLNAPGDNVAAVIEGIKFGALVANTGRAINVDATADGRLSVRNCSFNDNGNLQSYLVRVVGPARVELQDCELAAHSTFGVVLSHASGFLRLIGGRLSAPVTYASDLISIQLGSARISGVDFDFTAHTTGTLTAVAISSSSGQHVVATGNTFRGTAGAIKRAFSADSGVRLVTEGNSYDTNMVPFATGLLLTGSSLDLLEYATYNAGSSPAFTLPQGYRNIFVNSIATSGPAITFPAGMFYGQELRLTYYNGSASSVVPSFATTALTGTTVPTVGPGNTLSGVFVFEDRNGSNRWIQKGTWGVGLTLV